MSELVHHERLSPNYDERHAPVSMVVIHYTEMESATAAIDRLTDPESKVSAHYVISEGGEVTRLVPEEKRAWHAGVSYWRGETDVNTVSVGIVADHRFGEGDGLRQEEPVVIGPRHRGFELAHQQMGGHDIHQRQAGHRLGRVQRQPMRGARTAIVADQVEPVMAQMRHQRLAKDGCQSQRHDDTDHRTNGAEGNQHQNGYHRVHQRQHGILVGLDGLVGSGFHTGIT